VFNRYETRKQWRYLLMSDVDLLSKKKIDGIGISCIQGSSRLLEVWHKDLQQGTWLQKALSNVVIGWDLRVADQDTCCLLSLIRKLNMEKKLLWNVCHMLVSSLHSGNCADATPARMPCLLTMNYAWYRKCSPPDIRGRHGGPVHIHSTLFIRCALLKNNFKSWVQTLLWYIKLL
jgi:hypothetical protein